MDATTPIVKCADCGFLAARSANMQHILAGMRLMPPNEEYRTTGIIAHELAEARCGYEPVCAAGEFNVAAEFVGKNHEDSGRPIALGIIQRERTCLSFRKLCKGFTPKEHLQMKSNDDRDAREKEWHAFLIANAGTTYDGIVKRSQWRSWAFGVVSTFLGGIGGAALTYFMAKYLGLTRDGRPAG